MASKNFLKQVRALDRQQSLPYASATWWQVWVPDQDADDEDDDEEGEAWMIIADGTLDTCLNTLQDWISMAVDQEFRATGTAARLSAKYDDEPKKYLAAWEQRQRQRRETIRRQCLAEGSYVQEGEWMIHSALNLQELAHEARRAGS